MRGHVEGAGERQGEGGNYVSTYVLTICTI